MLTQQSGYSYSGTCRPHWVAQHVQEQSRSIIKTAAGEWYDGASQANIAIARAVLFASEHDIFT